MYQFGEPPESTDAPHVKPTLSVNPAMIDSYLVDTSAIDKHIDDDFKDNYVSSEDSINDILIENHQTVEAEVQSKNGQVKQTINTHVVDLSMNDNLDLNEESKGQEKRNEKDNDDEIPISHITQTVIKSVSKPQDNNTEENKKDMMALDEESIFITVMKGLVRSMKYPGKDKKNKKEVHHNEKH